MREDRVRHGIAVRLGTDDRAAQLLLDLLDGHVVENDVAAMAGAVPLAWERVALPAGLSFFVLQAISYLVDVYRQDVRAERNFIDFAAYKAMFGQLIAGPIIRWAWVEKEIAHRTMDWRNFCLGARRFMIGMSMKVLVADTLAPVVDAAFALRTPSLADAWIGCGAYTLQLFFDFAGYSAMAIGLGLMMGFHLPENFRYPLCSRSVRDFWRRWHITLGRWFRDYLYIPLGGSRCSMGHWLLNLLLVWALTGLWHGASWNFVLWGLWFGLLSVLERLWEKHVHVKLPKAVQHGYLLFAAILGFVFFLFTEKGRWTAAFAQMFGGAPLWSAESAFWAGSYAVTLIVSLLAATPVPAKLSTKLMQKLDSRSAALGFLLRLLFMLLLLLLSAAHLADGTFSPFLYFRF